MSDDLGEEVEHDMGAEAFVPLDAEKTQHGLEATQQLDMDIRKWVCSCGWSGGERDQAEKHLREVSTGETMTTDDGAAEYGDGTHQAEGVGMDTVVRCADTEHAYGPGTLDPTTPEYCPYCGDSVDDDDHRVAMSFDEVFCENTSMSTWRHCPGCGESGVEIGAE